MNSKCEQLNTEQERANAEVTKANEEVAKLDEVSKQVEEATKNNKPMTSEEIESLGNGLIDVNSSEISSVAEEVVTLELDSETPTEQ